MSGVAVALAFIGGLTGPASLIWQVFRWRRSQGTRMRVGMFRVDSVWLNLTTTENYELLVITALNQSEHAVRVTSVGIEALTEHTTTATRPDWEVWDVPQGATLPGLIQAHDEGRTSQVIGQAEMRTWQAEDLIRAYVETADGSRFETPWTGQDGISKPLPVMGQLVPIPDWIIDTRDD